LACRAGTYQRLAYERWLAALGEDDFARLLKAGEFSEVAQRAVSIEARTNLLFSFEKMALRDASKSPAGARLFATAPFEFLHGPDPDDHRFAGWCAAAAGSRRRQTRLLTWPLVMGFGFTAQPRLHFFSSRSWPGKPRDNLASFSDTTRDRSGRPIPVSWRLRNDLRELRLRDMINVQLFLWAAIRRISGLITMIAVARGAVHGPTCVASCSATAPIRGGITMLTGSLKLSLFL